MQLHEATKPGREPPAGGALRHCSSYICKRHRLSHQAFIKVNVCCKSPGDVITNIYHQYCGLLGVGSR